MITINQALALVQQNLPEPETQEKCLADAQGCFLAADIFAPEPSPRFANSAMDGYAVRAFDLPEASKDNPVSLRLIGESRAGEPFPGTVGPGEAIRISTGAMLAAGADTVIRVEDTEESDNSVRFFTAAPLGKDVRQAGEEFKAGEKLISRGTRITSRQLALLAAVGITEVQVFAKPRAAILGTGSELIVAAAQEIKPHQIRDSNTLMLTSAVTEAGGTVIDCRRVEDDLELTTAALHQTLSARPDIIICSGGVSVGRHDHVKAAAEQAGFTTVFWRVRQKPGKPLLFARKGNTLLFGLPGNPVSAFMCFIHYIRPVLACLNGMSFSHPLLTAQAKGKISNTGNRPNMIRLLVSSRPGSLPEVSKADAQGSHMLTSITAADGYTILEPGASVAPGSLVEVFLL